MPRCHLLKGKLFLLAACFSHAIIQCFPCDANNSRRQEITSGAEKQEGNDKAVTWMRQRSAERRNRPQTGQEWGDVTPHLWKCPCKHRLAPEGRRGGHWRSRSWGWQLPVPQVRFCTTVPSLFKSVPLVTQSSCSSSMDLQGLTVTGESPTVRRDGTWGDDVRECPFTNSELSTVGLGTSCVFLGLHFIHWTSL